MIFLDDFLQIGLKHGDVSSNKKFLNKNSPLDKQATIMILKYLLAKFNHKRPI